VSDPLDALLDQRAHQDRGLRPMVIASVAGHLVFAGAMVVAPMFVRPPRIEMVQDGIVIALPPGGRGTPNPAPGEGPEPPATQAVAPPPSTTPPVTEAPAPPPPTQWVKPPQETKVPKDAIPPLEDKRNPRTKPTPPPAAARAPGKPGPSPAATTASRGTGTTADPLGLPIGVPGPGVPEGTDYSGDWYLAGVQRKIWVLWTQQAKPNFEAPIGVTFTILADGTVTDVRVTQPSGISQLDFAAARAVQTAAPFTPLPRHYGTERYTIQAQFRPTS
jgi:protein TonB